MCNPNSRDAIPHFLQCFVLPRDSDGRVSSEILEPILTGVKVEEVQAEESPPGEEELDSLAFNSYPFPVEPLSSRPQGGSILGSTSLHGGDLR